MYLRFKLAGDMAMWRNYHEANASYSSVLPAPSNIAGLCGAALGFASPRTYASKEKLNKKKVWEVSRELLDWQRRYDLHLAVRWSGGKIFRSTLNVNGIKLIGEQGPPLQLQQHVIEEPEYDVVVRLTNDDALVELEKALHEPSFPLCLGASFCRAIIEKIEVNDKKPENSNWAFVSTSTFGEYVPLSRHITDPKDSRRISDQGEVWISDSETREFVLLKGWL